MEHLKAAPAAQIQRDLKMKLQMFDIFTSQH